MANLTRYSQPMGVTPLGEALDQLFREAFTWPHISPTTVSPTTSSLGWGSNLYETGDSYIMQILLPGVQADELEITARENVLSLHGKTDIDVPQGATAIWAGVNSGEFRQAITLPGEVDAESASAEYHDGILTLTLPKSARAKVRTIRVGNGQRTIEGQKK